MKERVLENDYPIYASYFYLVDGKVYLSDYHGITAEHLRRLLGAKEIKTCDILGRGGFAACALESAHFGQKGAVE